VGDKGIRGLIIKNNVSRIEVLDKISFNFKKQGSSRRQETHWKEGFLSSQDLCYEEDINEGVLVEVTSGTLLSFLINQTLKEGITGLQWFSGIPGTVGGAVWNNIHGADLFFGDFLNEVTFIDKDLTQKKLLRKDLDLSYNKTCFQDNSKIILSVKLLLPLGNKVKALNVAKEWIKRKSVQPKNSAGCTFSNLTKEKAKRLNLENCGAGFIIDKVLNLKGLKIGGAGISDKHANFIVTDVTAKANDVVKIIDTIQLVCMGKLGIKLEEEIVRVGDFS
ncbi:MAG: FAD-binding protein, partial [bacterium]